MRIWYVVDTVEYWLEPVYKVQKNFIIRFEGCRLYNASGEYKGWWPAYTWPAAVRQTVKETVTAKERRDREAERLERARVRHTTWLKK